jgi:hypothetical protein
VTLTASDTSDTIILEGATGVSGELPASTTISLEESGTGGDDGWDCPGLSRKYDNLSGPTWTVPTFAAYTVTAVWIKAGPDHHGYPNATSGDVINVKADTGHDTSHAHVCMTLPFTLTLVKNVEPDDAPDGAVAWTLTATDVDTDLVVLQGSDRKSVVEGDGGSGWVDHGGRRVI